MVELRRTYLELSGTLDQSTIYNFQERENKYSHFPEPRFPSIFLNNHNFSQYLYFSELRFSTRDRKKISTGDDTNDIFNKKYYKY